MSLIVGTLVVIGAFAALVIGVPWIFASSGGGVIIGAGIAYAAGLAVTRGLAKKRDRLATGSVVAWIHADGLELPTFLVSPWEFEPVFAP